AVGNMHGMLRNAPEPRLDIPRISNVRAAAGVPLVLHGGSGTSDEDFREAIKAGISLVHINTEIRVAFVKALAEYLTAHPDEVAPYKVMKEPTEAMQKVIEARLRLFSGM
ncbi:MAG: class II fructose-bisphosphate aldolase, partial [Minisyncoccia bacterium]